MTATSYWGQTPEGFRRVESVPLSDRGFRYGMAFFETLRVDGGRILFLTEHLESLREACAAAAFPVRADELAEAGATLRQHLGAGDRGVARLQVTAGDGAPGDPVSACRVFASFEARAEPAAGGLRLRTSPAVHHPRPGGRKTHNYWDHTAALLAARSADADEALLFDGDDCLVSAAMANVFIVNPEGALATPALALGARAGILRAWVGQRREVRETVIDRATLRRATEVFLTNSWIGARSAQWVDDRELPGGPVAAALRRELQACYDRIPR